MVEYMLSDVITQAFEKTVGKHQSETRRAMHIGFGIRPSVTTDQYQVIHMYIFAPYNYVYVVIQGERIDEDGERHVEPMEILSYHDSCWRDAIQRWIFKNRDVIDVFKGFKLFDWNDVIQLTKDEVIYLNDLEMWQRDDWKRNKQVFYRPNPFDNRGIWAKS